ncbi:MAG: hypothetical protein HOY75_26865 [Streptomyces sp.]|nr:hypothetical protein [Streptomyces sp.]
MTDRSPGPSAARIAVTGGSVAATLLLTAVFSHAQHAEDADRARQAQQQAAVRQAPSPVTSPQPVKIVTVVRRHVGGTTPGRAAAPQAPAAAARPAPAAPARPAAPAPAPAPATNSGAS